MLSWQDLRDVKFDSIIIGNGASIAVSPRFSYRELVVSRILRTFVDGVPRRFQLTSATVST